MSSGKHPRIYFLWYFIGLKVSLTVNNSDHRKWWRPLKTHNFWILCLWRRYLRGLNPISRPLFCCIPYLLTDSCHVFFLPLVNHTPRDFLRCCLCLLPLLLKVFPSLNLKILYSICEILRVFFYFWLYLLSYCQGDISIYIIFQKTMFTFSSQLTLWLANIHCYHFKHLSWVVVAPLTLMFKQLSC